MAFSDAFLKEARQELERLMRERQEMDSRITALQSLLSPSPSAGRLVVSLPAGNGSGPKKDTKVADMPFNFRRVVFGIIKEIPGITTPTVTKTVKDRGLLPGGSTDLHHRVYNEIWRLRRDGEVQEHQGGWVVVKD